MSDQDQTPSDADLDSEGPRDVKVIKRYTNRKLYDTEESRYVTLDEIAQMIKAGSEVKIIDNRSKEDLTSVTLAQIIFEEEKKRSQMPLGVLREIIRHGGEAVTGFYQERVSTRIGERLSEVKAKAEALREDMEQRVRAAAGAATSMLRREDGSPEDPRSAAAGAVREAMAAGERAVEELRGRVDATVKQAMEALGTPTSLNAELDKLGRRIEALEKRLEKLK